MKKKTEPEFPPESCGACVYCVVTDDDDARNHEGVCYSMPPYVVNEHGSVRPMVDWASPPCCLFKMRHHA